MIKIAVCNRKTDKKYKNQSWSWEDIAARNAAPIKTNETIQEYKKLPKTKRDALKDHGGFVGGWLREGIRKNGNVIGRQIGTLDADNVPDNEAFLKATKAALRGITYFIYSTHSHTKEEPRYRVCFLLDREATEEEYQPLMRKVAEKIGMDSFDDSTYQANRMMYWASCSQNADFYFDSQEGSPLDVDGTLNEYDDWKDAAQWPTSSRQSEIINRSMQKQEDPLEKSGVVGAFCRAYTIQEAMDAYLPGTYAPSESHDNRYDFIPGEGTAGVVIYEDKWAYSHHGTDPAGQQLVNAFDLVRVHKFGELDDRESFTAMTELAIKDEKVREELSRDKIAEALEDFEDAEWIKTLEVTKKGDIKDSLQNIVNIIRNDSNLTSIAYNQLKDSIDTLGGKLPWDRIKPGWSDTDTAALKVYLSAVYKIYAPTKTLDALKTVAAERAFHPIKEYLNGLPAWDKTPRVSTLLIDYFGSPDNPYTRAAIKKTLVAAVARIYKPGTKFDSVLILVGPQGAGKSTFFSKLGGDWFSDSLSLTDMKDKAGAEKLQGYWLLELGELAGIRKAEVETVKSFISRTDDKYRAPYGSFVESHPRQSIIVGSTNAEDGFLRDLTGNRRFWPVSITGDSPKKSWELTKKDVEQIWAEALSLYNAGETLRLEGIEAEIAAQEQLETLEADEREGMVIRYLNKLLPEDWDDLSLTERRAFVNDEDDDLLPLQEGTERRKTVSNIEIWAECFGREPSTLSRKDSYNLSAIMARIPGWTKNTQRQRIPLYGLQRVYSKK